MRVGARELTQTYLQFLGISEGSRGVEAAVELVVEVVAEFLSGGDLAVPGGVIARPGGVCAHERTRPHAGLTQPDSHSNSQTLKLAAFHEPFHEPAEIKDQMQKLLAHLHLGQDELRAEIEMGQDHS